LQEFELLKKLILDKDQEMLFNKIPKPNLLEIVDNQEKNELEEAKKPLEEELKPTSSVLEDKIIDGEQGNVVEKIKKSADDRRSHLADEQQQIQEIYDKLKRERNQSIINDKLLTALEEYVVKNRQKDKETAAAHDNIRTSRERKPKDKDDSELL